MGTVLQVTVVAADTDTARRLADACWRVAERWDDVLTTWRADGELATLNRRAGLGPTTVSSQLALALRQMLFFSTATGGAFNPAVGPWVDLWRTPAPTLRPGAVPRLADVVGIDDSVVALAAGTVLDAGAIGKAVPIGAMIDLLRAGGATAAFIDFGGSGLTAFQSPPENPAGWVVAVSGLRQGEMHGTMQLRDASLSTSRASGPGSAAGPIIDPGTGRPVAGPRVAVVLAADPVAANAWSTALVVLGRQGLEKAEEAGIEALVEDAGGRAATVGFERKLEKGT